jgi:hypothetical protein
MCLKISNLQGLARARSRYFLELVSGRSGQTLAPTRMDTGSKINEKVLFL